MADELLTEELEEESQEEVQEEAQPETSWDKERQFRNELSSANRKLGSFEAENKTLQAKLEELQSQMAAADKARKAPDADQEDLDDYDTLKNAVLNLRKKVSDSERAEREAQKEKQEILKRFEALEEAHKDERGLKVINEMCDGFDKKYGATVRNTALKNLRKSFDECNVADMNLNAQRAWITKVLELEYIKAKEASGGKKEAKKKETVSVDPGTGGGAPVSGGDDIKEGNFDEVKAQMQKKYSS